MINTGSVASMHAHRRYQQFLFEKALRERILASAREERPNVITAGYDELFSSFPDHTVFAGSQEGRARIGRLSAGMIAPLLPVKARVLEVGCGRGDTIHALSAMGFSCWGIEISETMVNMANELGGATVVQGTADRLNFQDGFFDCVFSQEMIEHLHPDDSKIHIQDAFRVLRSNGIFSIETPNRTTGPQDVSRGVGSEAQGLHLKEYSVAELIQLLHENGFIKIRSLLAPQVLARRLRIIHLMTRVPAEVKMVQDALLNLIPFQEAKSYIGKAIGLDDIFIFAAKP